MFPFLGPELIECLLNRCTPQKGKRRRSLMERLISGPSTEDEANEAQRSTDKMRCDEPCAKESPASLNHFPGKNTR
jgi:hypothetical protein